MIEEYGEEECQKILSSFQCPLNKDVEEFIHKKAIPFAEQHIAMTFLVFSKQNNQTLLIGYYTLTNKIVSIPKKVLSRAMQKRIKKFSQCDEKEDCYMIPIPLIAQLGKNYANPKEFHVAGYHLLKIACDKVRQAQRIIGGKMTYIECLSDIHLYQFYTSNEFYEFGQRENQSPEKRKLIQMLKYFK